MKLVSFGPPGQERPGIWTEDGIVDLQALDPGMLDWRAVLEADGLQHVERLVQQAGAAHRIDSRAVHPTNRA